MFIGKNQDGSFAVSESCMVNDGTKWINEDSEDTTNVSTLFIENIKDAENFEKALALERPLSSDDYESLELVPKSVLINRIFKYLSGSLTHIIDGDGDPFQKKNRILQGLEEFLEDC